MTETDKVHGALCDVYEVVEDAQARWAKVAKEEGWVDSCRPGCAGCCHMVATATLVEAIAIVVQLRRQGDLERFESMMDEPTSPIGRGIAAANESGMSTYEWLRRRIRCPLLSASSECLVYPMRPIVCRLYSTNGPREDCWVPGAKVPAPDKREIRDAAWAMFAELSRAAGLPLQAAPLPVVLQWALWIEVRGFTYFKMKLAGTIHESELASMLHWGRVESTTGRTWELTEDHGFRCGICGKVSHNRNDLVNRYCGQCNVFHEDLERTARIHTRGAHG